MDDLWRGDLRPGEPNPDEPVGPRLRVWTGLVLLIGVSVAIFLAWASPDALETSARVSVVTGFVGLLVVASVVVIRSTLHGGDDGGGPDRERLQPTPIRPTADPDQELRRILDDARLRDHSPTSLAALRNRRPGTA